MILVTGSTGQLGTAVVRTLAEKTPADRVAALVRDESKASALKEMGVDTRVGDYEDTDSLDRAMRGVDKVLLIAGTDEENRLRQHQNVVDAAARAGVQSVAYTSRTLKDRSTMANRLMEGHFQTEDYIKDSGLNYTIFRNVFYMDAIPLLVGGERVFDTGILLPAGRARVPFALRSDMGEAMANALLGDGSEDRTYKLTGTESYSFDDVAATLTDLSGKEVKYTPAEKPVFEAQMKERGVPETIVQRLIGFLTDFENGQEDEVTPDLENLLGRKPASLKEGLKIHFGL